MLYSYAVRLLIVVGWKKSDIFIDRTMYHRINLPLPCKTVLQVYNFSNFLVCSAQSNVLKQSENIPCTLLSVKKNILHVHDVRFTSMLSGRGFPDWMPELVSKFAVLDSDAPNTMNSKKRGKHRTQAFQL